MAVGGTPIAGTGKAKVADLGNGAAGLWLFLNLAGGWDTKRHLHFSSQVDEFV